MVRGDQVWFNGKILPADSAKVSLFTHGLHYGYGAFEGIRAYRQKNGGGAVFKLREHLERFFESAKILNLKIPFSLDQLIQASLEICKANHFEECYIRPVLFVGDGPLGIYPGKEPPIDVAILTWEWGNYLGDKGMRDGARLKISSFIRPHVNSAMTKGKITGQYSNSVLAKREAIEAGYDEALLLDAEGYLTEGSGENLFMVKGGEIKTTPLNSVLNGITRKSVMDYLASQGLTVTCTRFTRDEIWCADEVFLTGTAAEITPVREIDGRLIGLDGNCGPITEKVRSAYKKITHGEDPLFSKKWLTPII
ncbi:MAG: branched-chain amino acid transaminase [Bdellovibrio sp.]|nr:branched-chain amino acid transaminase [Bdellovibrio sp.]